MAVLIKVQLLLTVVTYTSKNVYSKSVDCGDNIVKATLSIKNVKELQLSNEPTRKIFFSIVYKIVSLSQCNRIYPRPVLPLTI